MANRRDKSISENYVDTYYVYLLTNANRLQTNKEGKVKRKRKPKKKKRKKLIHISKTMCDRRYIATYYRDRDTNIWAHWQAYSRTRTVIAINHSRISPTANFFDVFHRQYPNEPSAYILLTSKNCKQTFELESSCQQHLEMPSSALSEYIFMRILLLQVNTARSHELYRLGTHSTRVTSYL